MVVLLLIARFEFGGIPNQAFLWAKYLKKNGFKPIIIAQYTNNYDYTKLLTNNEIDFDFLFLESKGRGLLNTYRYLVNLKNEIDKFNSSYILPFNNYLGYPINFIWRFTSAKKCFFLERGHGVPNYYSLFDRFFKFFSIINSSGLIYNSDSASKNSIYLSKTYVIKNTFKLPETKFYNSFKFKNISDDSIVFVHIANLFQAKNFEILIKGWSKIRLIYPNSFLFIIGSDIKENQQNTVQKLNQDGIVMTGNIPDVFPYIHRADVCLLASHHEGCPNVILEYVSQRKLIVASNIPSIREILDPMNYKYLFDNLSVNDFVIKITNAIELCESDKERLFNSNYSKLLSNYSDKNFIKLLEILN